MPSTGEVLVTGASGNVGREVVRALRERGIRVRAAAASAVEGVSSVPLDFRDERTFATAVRGATALFLMRPPPISDVKRTLNPFVDIAHREGVRQVVFLSVVGADRNPIVPHHKVERHLAGFDGAVTILRPGFFAQNFGDAYRRDIVEDGRVFVPAGQGRVTFVDVRDVADVAAAAFAAPDEHAGQGYTLTGPEAVTFDEAAALLSRTLGRPIVYEPASVRAYVRHLRRRAMPWPQVLVQTILHVGLRRGQAESVDPTLARLLGRAPRTLSTYFADHRSLWG